ncbi:MAG: AzlD domain-containing protein [Rhodospirillaceae bacterium]
MADAPIWLTLLAAALATYFWRALGVLVAGRIDPNGPVFEWVGCVAYALLAGLTARMILLPIGPLQATDLGSRLLAVAMAVAALRLSRGNLALGVATGVTTLAVLTNAGLRVWG